VPEPQEPALALVGADESTAHVVVEQTAVMAENAPFVHVRVNEPDER